MANSVDQDQTAPLGAVCSVSKLFASILILSLMLGNNLQQTTSADDIFRCIFFLAALRVKRPLEKKTKICYQDHLSLNAGQKYCRMLSKRAFCNTFNLH